MEKARYKCEVIAKRCDRVEKIDGDGDGNGDRDISKPSAGQLVRNACRQLKCVNGVLQGHPALRWRQKSDDGEEEDYSLIWIVLKFLVCVAICLVISVSCK